MEHKKSLWHRFLGYWLDPIFYYLNLYENGKPSLSRLMLVGGFVHAMITLSYIGIRMFNPTIAGQIRPAVSTGYLLFAGLAYSLIFGYRGFKLWLDSKGGGLDTAMNTEVSNRANVEKVEAGIIANRKIGAEHGVEFTE